MSKSHDDLPPDLDEVAALLRDERPEAGPERLERVRHRVAPARRSRRAASVAVASCLGLGIAFTGAGTGLAVSGLGSDGPSVRAQYPTTPTTPTTSTTSTTPAPPPPGATIQSQNPPPTPPPPSPPANDEDSGNAPEDDTLILGETGEAPADDGGAPAPAGGEAPAGDEAPAGAETRRLEADAAGEDLPFTGYAAVPVLLLGIGLLLAGVALRRRLKVDGFRPAT